MAEKKVDKVDKNDKSSKSNKSNKNENIENLDNLYENERVSVPLTPQNAIFKRSEGGLISLDFKNTDGTDEFFERIVIFRCFPITNPDEFLSVREPDSKKMGRGKEIGMIRYMKDFPQDQQELFLEELDRRYFSPEITKINSVKDKFGYTYWEAETNAGNMTFILNNPFSNIRLLEDGRVFIHDIDGNSYQIKDPGKLDSHSFRKIEIYI